MAKQTSRIFTYTLGIRSSMNVPILVVLAEEQFCDLTETLVSRICHDLSS